MKEINTFIISLIIGVFILLVADFSEKENLNQDRHFINLPDV